MKIEKRVKERNGHLTMMEDDGMTKAVMLGRTKEKGWLYVSSPSWGVSGREENQD